MLIINNIITSINNICNTHKTAYYKAYAAEVEVKIA